MKRYWRTWYLLFKLRNKCYATASEMDPRELQESISIGHRMFVPKDVFLTQIAEHNIFGCRRSKKEKSERMNKDAVIMEWCCAQSPQLMLEQTAGSIGWAERLEVSNHYILIRTTGHGDEFADFTNALVGFASRYKIIGVTIWGVAVYISYPVIVNFLTKSFHFIQSIVKF